MKEYLHWYNFLLSIFFWIFLWRLFDLILDELNLNKRHKLIFYLLCTLIVGGLISYDKSFFK
jgi:hypothetical protein